MENIIFIAPPAAGKGTQSKLLSKKYNMPHISAGDLLRDEVASGSVLGQELKAIMDEGKLVDANVILRLLENRLTKEDCKNGYILDGYPRNLAQAASYDELLEKINKKIGKVIFLDIDASLAVKRITGRLVCPKCGSSYNINNEELKPHKDGICDNCNHALEKRSDDNEQTILKRFDTYIQSTQELIDLYKNRGVLYTIKISDTDSANDTFEQIERVIND